MSLNKIIIGFIIILVLVSGYVLYQMSQVPVPPSKVTINKQTFAVTVATTSAQQQEGLSGKKSLPQDQGLLFVFKNANRYPFWMKGMNFPLDIVFINNQKVISIIQNAPAPKGNADNLPVYTPEGPVTHVLEINSELVKKYNIKKGDTVKIDLK
jgi:uncharacterized protein